MKPNNAKSCLLLVLLRGSEALKSVAKKVCIFLSEHMIKNIKPIKSLAIERDDLINLMMRLTERELFNKTHRPPARPSVPPQHGQAGPHGPGAGPAGLSGRHQPSTSGQANHSSGHHHNNDLPNG